MQYMNLREKPQHFFDGAIGTSVITKDDFSIKVQSKILLTENTLDC